MVREALASLRTLDPDREPMQGWLSYYTVYGPAAHLLGDFEDELRMAQRARAAFPGNLVALQLEGDALPALGKRAETEALLTAARDMAPSGGATPGDLMTTAAQELAAHGEAAASKRWLENAVQYYDGLPAADASTPDSRAGKAYALYSLGRYRDAAPIYEALAADFPANGAWKAWGGYLAALTGDKAVAADVGRRIEAGEIAFTPVNRAIWRGLIAAALNDRDAAIARLRESGLRPRWMHRDPVLMKVFKDDPRWAEYLKPIG
jgi:tetratricopeptide (TPR) repeat protein